MKIWMLAPLVSLLLTGCAFNKQASSVGYLPHLPKPQRPQLEALNNEETVAFQNIKPESLKAKLVRNSDALQLYSIQLETTIDMFNSFADMVNQRTNAALGIKSSQGEKTEEAK